MNLRPDSTALAVPVAVNPVDVAGPLPARTEPAVAETEVQTPAQTAPRQTQATWQRQAPALPRIPAGPANIVPPYRHDATFMYPIAGKTGAPQADTADTRQTLHADSISMGADSTAQEEKAPPAIVLTPPRGRQLPEISMPDSTSWITGLLLLLFCLVCFRFRNNKKYVSGLLRDLFEVRERHNVFDDTVRETSFLVLLNILWSVSAGVLLWGVLIWAMPYDATFSFTMPPSPERAIKICIGVTLCYTILMSGAYYLVGSVFSDRRHAAMWVKGYAASQALLSVLFFPLALLCLYYPQWRGIILAVALGGFILAKIIFICKGFRIFFAQLSSWVLFLYYLCSLELVPLALTFFSACQLCAYLLH